MGLVNTHERLRFAPIVALDAADGAAPFAMDVGVHGEAHVRLTCAIGALISAHEADRERRPIALMVSLSLDELARLEVESVAAALTAADVAPELLMLRVPQYSVGAHTPALDRVAALGVTVVVSNLFVRDGQAGQLAGAPIDVIELPAQVVDEIDRSAESLRYAEEWMAAAHRVDWLVLARNVRRRPQAELLRRLGCDLAAGPLMGAPVDPSYFAAAGRTRSRLAG